jgi:colanic acid/amylovoran biosynthesis glycosyltransferase
MSPSGLRVRGATEPAREAPVGGGARSPSALQRCDRFVARTMNWMYDHFRALSAYRPLVLAGELEHRDEFPEVEARKWGGSTLPRRVWRKLRGPRPFPGDLRRLRAEDPAVLHSHFGYVAAQDFGLRQALGVPWVVGFYGADVYELPSQPEWRDLYARLFDEAARVLPLGPRMGERLAELGCPTEKIVVHNLGVDVSALPTRQRVRNGDEPLEVLFAGTFREKKGVPYLVEAMALLRDEGIPAHLHLAGDASSKPGDARTKQEILDGIERRGLSDRVTHHSYLPFRDLVRLALACHVLATPSVTATSGDSEGTVFIIQQMMATGMPVVATRHADIPYTFGPLADRLVPERDASALARALRRYVDDPGALATDGTAFRTHAEASLDVRDAARALEEIYDGIA